MYYATVHHLATIKTVKVIYRMIGQHSSTKKLSNSVYSNACQKVNLNKISSSFFSLQNFHCYSHRHWSAENSFLKCIMQWALEEIFQKHQPAEPSKIVTTTFPVVIIMLPINSLSLDAREAILRSSFNFIVSSNSASPQSSSSRSSSYIKASSGSNFSLTAWRRRIKKEKMQKRERDFEILKTQIQYLTMKPSYNLQLGSSPRNRRVTKVVLKLELCINGSQENRTLGVVAEKDFSSSNIHIVSHKFYTKFYLVGRTSFPSCDT